MPVFISYRRADSGYVTDRIYDHLIRECDEEAVFRDLESIALGTSFRDQIAQALQQCHALLAIIGPTWLSVTDQQGRRRLDDPEDLVRIEIETALIRGIPVIPVIIEGSSVPPSGSVPGGLSKLVDQQAIVVRRGMDFEPDMERLISFLRANNMLDVIRQDEADDQPFDLLGGF